MASGEEYGDLCRLCATKLSILMSLPIFGNAEKIKNIDKKIVACLPVQVSLTNLKNSIIKFFI